VSKQLVSAHGSRVQQQRCSYRALWNNISAFNLQLCMHCNARVVMLSGPHSPSLLHVQSAVLLSSERSFPYANCMSCNCHCLLLLRPVYVFAPEQEGPQEGPGG
jgi:hypothetical protein